MNNETIKAEIARIDMEQSKLNRAYAQETAKLDVKLEEIRDQCPHSDREYNDLWQECLVCGETFDLAAI